MREKKFFEKKIFIDNMQVNFVTDILISQEVLHTFRF